MPLPNERFTGIRELTFTDEELAKFYETKECPVELYENEYLLLKNENGEAVDKYRFHKGQLVKIKNRTANLGNLITKVKPLNEYQECMVDMILDNSITVKTSLGIPGGGKSLLFIVYGLEKVMKGEFKKLVYIKNNVDIGHEKIGALPGYLDEKLDPWIKVLYDIFGDKYIVDKLKNDGKIEIEYIGHTVGRTYNDSFIVIDDAQQLSKALAYNLCTRLGHNSVICFAGDLYQTYSKKYENGNNGLKYLCNKLSGQNFFASVHTNKSERSETAQKCAELLFDGLTDNI